jgi:hypothetical protein
MSAHGSPPGLSADAAPLALFPAGCRAVAAPSQRLAAHRGHLSCPPFPKRSTHPLDPLIQHLQSPLLPNIHPFAPPAHQPTHPPPPFLSRQVPEDAFDMSFAFTDGQSKWENNEGHNYDLPVWRPTPDGAGAAPPRTIASSEVIPSLGRRTGGAEVDRRTNVWFGGPGGWIG